MATATKRRSTKRTQRSRTLTIDALLHNRQRRPGSFYKLDGSLAIDTPPLDASVDLDAMAATAIISTPAKDRVNDVLIPTGCNLDNYRLNPVVLWNHGFDSASQPIGRSEDADGNLSVRISDKAVEATCYFSQRSLIAAQVFELIAEKIIRATSVRENPIKSYMQMGDDREQLLVVEEWELIEWSWVDVGCNPEAVAKALSRNRLAGKPIVEPLFKSLSLSAPEPAVKGRGWSPPVKGKPVTKSTKTKADPPEDEDRPEDEEEQTAGDGDEPPPDEQEHKGAVPQGATMLSEMHSYLSAGIAKFEADIAACEQPDVKEAATQTVEAMRGLLATNAEEVYAKHYPHLPALSAESDKDSEAVVKYITSVRLGSLQLAGLLHSSKSLLLDKNLKPEQRVTIQAVNARISKILSDAKRAAAEAAKRAEQTEEQKQLSELRQQFAELQKTLEGAKRAG